MPQASVVVPAAGLGTRMRAGQRKPYIEIDGQPILLRTLGAFAGLDDVAEVVLTVHAEDVGRVQEDWGEELAALKVRTVCAGGTRRQDSVYNGLRQTSALCEVVLIHDAVRPLVSPALIRETIAAAAHHGAAIVAAKVKETVKEVDERGRIVATRPRQGLWLAQTPQGFRRALIIEAHDRARASGVDITDDAQAVELLGKPVFVVEGDYSNIKITTPEDLVLADALLRQRGRG